MKKYLKKLICYILMVTLLLSISNVQVINAAAKYYKMTVHYIDVGESDSVLIQSNGKSMLIDAGDNGDGEEVVKYLKDKKVKKLDYIICTHPHADHLGGMDDVINSFDIGKVLMPDVVHTTDTFEDVLNAIEDNELKITNPKVGTKYTLGKASFTIVAPNSDDYENLNDWSIAIRLVNGKNSFLFIGDCEEKAIDDIIDNDEVINSDVLMCGHHGSDTSTNKELLKAVTPKYAVISVGENSYGHPSKTTLDLLRDNKVTTYRTDENGTIVATSTGTKITFKATATKFDSKSTTKKTTKDTSKTDNSNTVVYVTKTGKKYHLGSCSSLSKSKIKTTVKEAHEDGYEPCDKCNPPE